MIKSNISLQVKNYLAFCIDGLYTLFIGSILSIVALAYIDLIAHKFVMQIAGFFGTSLGATIFYFFIISFNATIQEIFFNTTLGKRIFGLVVVDDDYQKPTKRQIFARNLLYSVDTFLVIGSFPLIKGNGKTLGGYISKTKLVSRKYLKQLEERNTYGF